MWARIFFLTIIAIIKPIHATELSLRGTLQVINCSVNNSKPMDVSFGDAVGVNKVDGVRYLQPMPVEIICSQQTSGLLHLAFAGTPTDFDEAAIATNVNDLGIRLLQNDTPIVINQPLPLDELYLPTFSAVPVKRPNSQLSGGSFTGLTTLLITLE